MATIDAQRNQILHCIYELSDRGVLPLTSIIQVAKQLDLDEDQVEAHIMYLVGGGVVQWKSMGHVALTQIGIEKVEHQLRNAEAAVDDVVLRWTSLRDCAKNDSSLASVTRTTFDDLESRGVIRSGESLLAVQSIASANGLEWVPERKIFVKSRVESADAVTAPPNAVFVVHGRDHEVRNRVLTFLRAIDLKPIAWEEAVRLTGKPSPFIGDVVAAGVRSATAIVVLLTPDEEVRLHSDLAGADDTVSLQPRPNVLIEAGMALGIAESRTILVSVGSLRAASDLAGRHYIDLTASNAAHSLAAALRTAGCTVNFESNAVADDAQFHNLAAAARSASEIPRAR